MNRTTRPHRRLWQHGLLISLAMIGFLLSYLGALPATPAQTNVSNYDLAQAAAFNQVETYPITALPSAPTYRPVGQWVGRLVLPKAEEYAAEPGDWTWMEVWHAPAEQTDLLGQTIKVTWRDTPGTQTYVTEVTSDVEFTEKAENFGAGGNLVPFRLNGRKAVGPLQSLAGARPKDDITVKLVGNPKLVSDQDTPVVEIGLEPIQITGREYGLVKLLATDTSVDQPLPEACPGEAPCPSEYFSVQHFNPGAKDFSGPLETIRIPQQPQLKGDRFFSNIRDITDSPAGSEGWYVYGSRDRQGVFTVQALQPRKLVQLTPDQVIVGKKSGRHYLDSENWGNMTARKGEVQRVLVSPTAESADAAIADWQLGDYALVMHLFGGIGGENKELTPAGTVSGHFAYGLAEVVEEPIAQEPQFKINYQQIYAHNSGGIISGTHDWSSYAGDMQRGWIGTRPFSDIVVKQDYFIEDLKLGDTTLSLFKQILIQAQVIAARYRTGDGTGVSTVTPSTSCVQDSNQALYIAIQQIRYKAQNHPEIQAYIEANPNDPEVQKVDRFAALAEDLVQALTPYGVIRPDWENNSEELAGVNARGNGFMSSGIVAGIFSWRTMMPRWGQDDIANVFLENGADLWFLRPNQIGGFDPSIEPIPATALFGLIPGVSRVALRSARSFAVPVTPTVIGLMLGALVLFVGIALPYARRSRFLSEPFSPTVGLDRPMRWLFNLIKLFFIPALLEELIFRVGLLPHPSEAVALTQWFAWAALSLGLFVLYHVAFAKMRRRGGKFLSDRRFLLMVFWLGLVLTILYGLTGSMFAVTIVHWVVVVGWLNLTEFIRPKAPVVPTA
jgi:predicted Abi (CAAX) family protease